MINAYDLTLFMVFCCALSAIYPAYKYIKNFKKLTEEQNNKTNFVEAVTHDLKTPTNAQIRALDLLLGNTFGELKTEQREIIREIKNSCKYMNTLIYSILDTCKTGNRTLTPELFDFTKLTEECIREISYLAEEKGQKISILKPKTPIFIFADKVQIKRVIINLTGNAVWYGRKNTVIEISAEENKNFLNFAVKNHSRYIEKEKLTALFDKYQTEGGTGLGLFLSKQIILSHKGTMSAKSDENNICTFGFTIPENREKFKTEKIAC
ncbi:HAMP domain-containing histidine kinase [bacterium]|nr:HAMP domain-containing histidine kinase [bacterium]